MPGGFPIARRTWRGLRRAAAWPLVIAATGLVLFDDAFRVWVKPAVAALAGLAPVRRLEAWIAGLPPYGIVTLFIIPMIVIEPMKLAALYLMGAGHIVTGLATLVVAKIVGVGLAERLFAIGRDKLLSIGWFRWGFERAVRIKDGVHAWLATKPFWRRAMALIARIRARLALARKAIAERLGRRPSGRWGAARRLAGANPPSVASGRPER